MPLWAGKKKAGGRQRGVDFQKSALPTACTTAGQYNGSKGKFSSQISTAPMRAIRNVIRIIQMNIV
jgi:hypothetical protein